MLAEIPTTAPFQTASWLGCAAFMIMFVNGALKLVDRLRGERPEPPNEQLGQAHSNLARRVDAHAADIAELRREIKQNQADQARTDSTHRASLYRKIDDTRAELEAKMEAHRGELSRDIKDMPAQIITLLKNTDAI